MFSTGFRARPHPVGLIALWNCGLMKMVAGRRTLTAAFQSCFSAVGLTLATPYLTSFGDERVRAWGEYARFIVFLDHTARYCHVSRWRGEHGGLCGRKRSGYKRELSDSI